MDTATPNLNSLLNALARLVAETKTGTFFIATLDNTSCRIALNQGTITHCTYGREHGLTALHALARCTGGKSSFIPTGHSTFRANSVVNPQEAMNILGLPSLPVQPATPPAEPKHATPPPSKNRFYRGYTGVEPSPSPTHEGSTTLGTMNVNNRYYRGG